MDNEEFTDSNFGENWGEDRTLMADRIQWLCQNEEAKKHVTTKGIGVSGIKIKGDLDLSFSTVPFLLGFIGCHFTDTIKFYHSKLRFLELRICYINKFEGNSLVIEGDLIFKNVVQASGNITLGRASIGGNLIIQNSHIGSDGDTSIAAFGIKIGGNAFLSDGLYAKGMVNLSSSQIGGNLECHGSKFHSDTGISLQVDKSTITGNVFLDKNSEFIGTVDFSGSSAMQFACDGSQFINPDGIALHLSSINVGSVFMRHKFRSEGKVVLFGANISGDLDFSGGQLLNNSDEFALLGQMMNVKGQLRFSDGFNLKGIATLEKSVINKFVISRVEDPSTMFLDLSSVHVDYLEDDPHSWLNVRGLILTGFTYNSLPIGSRFSINQRLDWLRKQSYNPQPYVQLAKFLRENGHDAEAKRVLLAKERDYGRFSGLNRVDKFLHTLSGWIIGYGYRPLQALWWMTYVVCLGAIIFALGEPKPFYQTQQFNGSVIYPEFNPIMYSLDAFLPIIDFRQETLWQPNGASKTMHLIEALNIGNWQLYPKMAFIVNGKFIKYYYWLHILLGWFFSLFFVAGLSGLVRR